MKTSKLDKNYDHCLITIREQYYMKICRTYITSDMPFDHKYFNTFQNKNLIQTLQYSTTKV